MPGARLSSDQRLSLIVDTQRMIAAAGDDLQSVMQQVAERSQAIIGADPTGRWSTWSTGTRSTPVR
jgi:hypothetical protein